MSFLMCMLLLGAPNALAQEAHTVFVPVIYPVDFEQTAVRTSACLEVQERLYAEPGWWMQPQAPGSPEESMASVLRALKDGDKAALKALSVQDPEQESERNAQIEAFIEQWKILSGMKFMARYDMDDLSVFVGELERGDAKMYFDNFRFRRTKNGRFVWAPPPLTQGARPSIDAILRPWIRSEWGFDRAEGPDYCGLEEVKDRSLVVRLSGDASWKPSRLHISGTRLGSDAAVSQEVKGLLTLFAEISRMRAEDADRLPGYMTPGGAKRMTAFLESAQTYEVERYLESVTYGQAPYYLLDASPLFVLYTKNTHGTSYLPAFFFVRTEGGQGPNFLWASAFHSTDQNGLFFRGPLTDKAQEGPAK